MATREEVGGLVGGGAGGAAVGGGVEDPEGVYIDGLLVESTYSECQESSQLSSHSITPWGRSDQLSPSLCHPGPRGRFGPLGTARQWLLGFFGM